MNISLKFILLIYTICINYSSVLSHNLKEYDCKQVYSSYDDFKTVLNHLNLTYTSEKDFFLQLDKRIQEVDSNDESKIKHLEFLKLMYYNETKQRKEALKLAEHFIFEENIPFCRHFGRIIDGFLNRLSGKDRNVKLIKLIQLIHKRKADLPERYVYQKLGILYYDLKQYKKAIEHYLVVQEFSDVSTRSKASYFNNIAICYEFLDQKEKAVYYYEKALELWGSANHDNPFRKAYAKYFRKVIENNILELKLTASYSDELMLSALKEEYRLADINGKNLSGSSLPLKIAEYAFKTKAFKEGIAYTNMITKMIESGFNLSLDHKSKYNLMLWNSYCALGQVDKAIEHSTTVEKGIYEKDRVDSKVNNDIIDLDKSWTTSMLLEREKALKAEKKVRLLTYLLLSILLVLIVIVYFGYRQQKQSGEIIKQKNKKIEQALITTQMLLKEMHHRVKNNLQLVSSIAYLEYTENDDEFDFERFENRIISLSMIHKLLYSTEFTEHIVCYVYLKDLIKHLQDTSDKPFKIILDIPELKLKSETMISLGLLVNELITNTIKHCIPEDNKSIEINVSMKIEPSGIVMVYKDNGGIYDESKLNSSTNSLGQNLIRLLIKKLKGKSSLDAQKGYCLNIRFPQTCLNEMY